MKAIEPDGMDEPKVLFNVNTTLSMAINTFLRCYFFKNPNSVSMIRYDLLENEYWLPRFFQDFFQRTIDQLNGFPGSPGSKPITILF